MKLIVVGKRDGKRAIAWGGLIASSLMIMALSVVGYIAARFVLPVPLFPGIVLAAVLPVGSVIGVRIRTAWVLPLDKLPTI